MHWQDELGSGEETPHELWHLDGNASIFEPSRVTIDADGRLILLLECDWKSPHILYYSQSTHSLPQSIEKYFLVRLLQAKIPNSRISWALQKWPGRSKLCSIRLQSLHLLLERLERKQSLKKFLVLMQRFWTTRCRVPTFKISWLCRKKLCKPGQLQR